MNRCGLIVSLVVCGLFWFAFALLGGCSKMPGVQAPPPRYDTGPLPADLVYRIVPAPDVDAACRRVGSVPAGLHVLACYAPLGHFIVLPTRGSDPLIFEALKRHEEAHARGWPADHPTA